MGLDLEKLAKEIREALARGYCHPLNESKILDVDLIKAMTGEVHQQFVRWHKELMSELPKRLEYNSEVCDRKYFKGTQDMHDTFMEHLRLEEKPTMLVETSEAIERAKKVLDAGEKPVWCEHLGWQSHRNPKNDTDEGFTFDTDTWNIIGTRTTRNWKQCPICGAKRPEWKHLEDRPPHPNYGMREPNLEEPSLKVPEKLDCRIFPGPTSNKINEIIDYLGEK